MTGRSSPGRSAGSTARSTGARSAARAATARALAALTATLVLAAAPGAGRAADETSIVGATRLSVLEDPVALDHAVQTRIYPEDPDAMVVTLRGGGVSVFDVSDPPNPRLRTRWSSDEDVEGQDRRGDLLVVVARSGALLTFDVSRPDRIVERGRVELESHGGSLGRMLARLLGYLTGPFDALHVRLHDAADGRRYALVTATLSGRLIAVDVTEPSRPRQVGALDTGVQLVEGIYVHRDHAFVGGFGWSGSFRAIDVSDPERMRVVHTLYDASYRQMVSEMSARHPDLLFAALWNDEGGIAVFDVSDPPRFRLVGRLVSPELPFANRVKLQGDHAFLPLESEPGGFAIVDVSDPGTPALAHLQTGIPGISTPYTLEVNRDHLYLFSSLEPRMAVFRLERGDARREAVEAAE